MNKSYRLIYKNGNDKTKRYKISEGKNKKKTPFLDVSSAVGQPKKT